MVSDAITPLTTWKLDWATSDPKLCKEIIQDAGRITEMEDLVVDGECGIEGRVQLRRVGDADIGPIETACATALRAAMWEEHGVQPIAQDLFSARDQNPSRRFLQLSAHFRLFPDEHARDRKCNRYNGFRS